MILKPSYLAAQNTTTASESSGAIRNLSLSIAIAYFCRCSIICLSIDLWVVYETIKVVVVVVEIDQHNQPQLRVRVLSFTLVEWKSCVIDGWIAPSKSSQSTIALGFELEKKAIYLYHCFRSWPREEKKWKWLLFYAAWIVRWLSTRSCGVDGWSMWLWLVPFHSTTIKSKKVNHNYNHAFIYYIRL